MSTLFGSLSTQPTTQTQPGLHTLFDNLISVFHAASHHSIGITTQNA
jgi:hypothetical protein